MDSPIFHTMDTKRHSENLHWMDAQPLVSDCHKCYCTPQIWAPPYSTHTTGVLLVPTLVRFLSKTPKYILLSNHNTRTVNMSCIKLKTLNCSGPFELCLDSMGFILFFHKFSLRECGLTSGKLVARIHQLPGLTSLK